MILHPLHSNNPLCFLVALGTVKTLDMLKPQLEWELRWNSNGNAEMRCNDQNISEDMISDMLAEYLGKEDPLFEQQYKDKADSINAYDKFVRSIDDETLQNVHIRRLYDFAACVAFPMKKTKPPQEIHETPFRFITGNTTFFGNAKNLAQEIKKNKTKIHETLFEDWDYSDVGMSMDWDPISLPREHALLPSDPSTSYNPSIYGANRLAMEAISLYPTVYDGKQVRTIGWHDKKFMWPIWDEYIGLDEIRGILSIDYSKLTLEKLNRIGIELYFSEKITLSSKKHFRFTSASKYTNSNK